MKVYQNDWKSSKILHSGTFDPEFSGYMDRAISRDQKILLLLDTLARNTIIKQMVFHILFHSNDGD